MHDVMLTLKDGRTFCGPMWAWRPQEGYMVLSLDANHYDYEVPERIYLDDVDTAIDKDVRYNATGETKDVDLLEKAREEGWKPKEEP